MVKSIKEYKGVGAALHVYLDSFDIPNEDLLDLMAIFVRHTFDVSQLRVFEHEHNAWIFDE